MKKQLLLVILLAVLAVSCNTQSFVLPEEAGQPTEQPTDNGANKAVSVGNSMDLVVVCVIANRLNLRESPSTSSPADNAGLSFGERLFVVDGGDDWMYVETLDGREGWVRAVYVSNCKQ